MKNWLKQRIRSAMHRRGMYVVRSMTPPNVREIGPIRRQWMKERGVSIVVDAGANVGQYAQGLRACGYDGRILSFEPLVKAHAALAAAAAADPDWKAIHAAVGEAPGSAAIHVAGNSQSSSLLPMLQRHASAAVESGYVSTEEITIVTLDSLRPDTISASDIVWLKLDVQGFEIAALRGARELLRQAAGIECELSLVNLYQGAPLIEDVIAFLAREGFRPASLEQGFTDQGSQRVLQVDGIFLKETA
jgi:FkbM family methyltransferase